MKRRIDTFLRKWRDAPRRRVLLVRGARQVGKTYSIRELGKSFDSLVEVNFEEHPEISSFFEGSLSPDGIVEKLTGYFGERIVAGQTLLFFDEVQACPNSLRSLRFFHERMPGLHVVAAGSLLEFALSAIPSFGVGRISSIFMYPFSFGEFLEAIGLGALGEAIATSDAEHPLAPPLHRKALDRLRTYCAIGGMPAVVDEYRTTRDIPGCQSVIDDIIEGLRDDFSKYHRSASIQLLAEVFQSMALQAGRKFMYRNVDPDSSHYELKKALDLLLKASLGHKVVHSAARGIPLAAQVKQRRFKILPFDIGIAQRSLNLDLPSYLVQTDAELVTKGPHAELFCGLELIANTPPHQRPELYYWHRESRSSNAEVDYVIAQGNTVVPVEIKSGTRGSMQSMYMFLSERGLKRGVRLSHENYSMYGSIETAPLYAAANLVLSARTR